MAKQSLKNAYIYFEDGSANASVISNIANFVCDTADTSGHFTDASGASQTLNGLGNDAPYVQVGSIFTVGGTEYVISAINNDGAGTDDVEFTGTLSTGTSPVTSIIAAAENRVLLVKTGSGNLTYSEKVTREYELERGKIDSVRDGDDEPLEVNLGFTWEWLKSSSTEATPTVRDVLKRTGVAWNWMSSSNDPCEPYAVDIRVDLKAECQGAGILGERLIFPDFRYESFDPDLEAGQIDCSGRCNSTEPIIDRIAIA